TRRKRIAQPPAGQSDCRRLSRGTRRISDGTENRRVASRATCLRRKRCRYHDDANRESDLPTLFGLGSTVFDPLAHFPDELFVGQRRRRPSIARIPATQYELVLADVMQDLLQRLVPVLIGVLELTSELAR